MGISKKEENGQTIYTIAGMPHLTENTLAALVEFLDQVPDCNYLLNYLANLEATALIYDPGSRDKWEHEFDQMQFLRNFLMQLRQYQHPGSSL
ncbi:hypothetical protein AHMF7605_10510 [Adhaeribacter arboris]|uniref:Uncharacterized protein n=1 Tax=Adhaeribacter arboris TaxID=2072846 RepID=A0A2T2YEN1_9BACT|nr:hypothetical protein [Adhaeribacter arboris]PSR53918.1 hypothetical protein AHMF7605_10510 [Adhaeribacter arboris]